MANYKKNLLFLMIFSMISCGKNKETEEHELEQKKEPNYEQNTKTDSVEPNKYDITYETPEDSIRAIKQSILREKKYTKKKVDSLTVNNVNRIETLPTPETSPGTPQDKKTKHPSFVYIKRILHECKIGVTMTQEDIETKFKIPKEAMKLVKSVTKIAPDELDIKWKSTWLVEKVSDAKFKDGRLKVRFQDNKMYTSGGAISIKYEKKLYSDLILIGRAAYIPSVKGYYWQIGNNK